MTFTTCFWALLSQKDLSFVYISPWLSKALGSEHDLFLGTSLFDYFHPEEQELARHDSSELVKKKTLSCSVTRCQYNTIKTIRKKLQRSIVSSSKPPFQQMPSQYSPASSTITSPNFAPTIPQATQKQLNEEEYIIMDLGMNVVSQDIVLACFHSDDVKQSSSNYVSSTCGESEFTNEEVIKLTSLMRKHVANVFSKVQTPPSTPFPEYFFNNETPNRIFQILDRKSRNLIFSWPDATNFNSYNKDDFSRLLLNVNLDLNNNNNIRNDNNNNDNNNDNNLEKTKSKNLDVETPNCLRFISDKQILSISGTYRQVESVISPFGDIIFACFQILPHSKMLGVSSAFTKPKSRSAPCSPATTINNNNGIVKRPRSPGSLSPLPTSYYSSRIGDDDIKQHYIQNQHSNSSYCPQEVPDFILEDRSSKRHRTSDSTAQHSVPVKISSSPLNTPHPLLLNPISPRISPSYHDQQQCCSQQQFPFPSQIISSKDRQQSPVLQHPQQHHVTPPSQPRQPSPQPSPQPQQQDYPSPTSHPSQFLTTQSFTSSNNHHMVQPQQPSRSPSSNQPQLAQQGRFTQFAPQRRNNGNNNNNNVHGIKKCESCHTSTSPEWRRGPTGHKTLCNACGLRYSRTIARENRKREQVQREQEQRQREQREREERARERANTSMMQPFSQYRSSNGTIIPGHHHHHHHHQTSVHPSHSGPPQFHPSTLPPLNHHCHHQPPPQHNIHHQHQIGLPPPISSASNNDRIVFLPPPQLNYQIGNSHSADNRRRDQRNDTMNMMNNMPPAASAYPKEAYFGRAQ